MKLPINWLQVLSVYLSAAAIVGYGMCFFEFAAPWLKLHSNLIDDGWVEVLVFAIWISVPWFLNLRRRQTALERMREGIHYFDGPRSMG